MAAVHLAAQKRNQWHQCKMLQKTHTRGVAYYDYIYIGRDFENGFHSC